MKEQLISFNPSFIIDKVLLFTTGIYSILEVLTDLK